jgi:hypothetical protein
MFSGALRRLQLLMFVSTVALCLIVPAAANATPTFLTAVNISDPGQDGFEPEVGTAPDGTVIAVWTRSDGSNFRIQSASRSATGAWSAAQTISDPGKSASGPAISVDSSGNAVVAYTQSDGTNLRINAAYRPAGGSFGAPVLVSDPGLDASAPDVSMDGTGRALVVWQRTDGTKLRVQASIRGPGAGGTFDSPTTLSAPGQDAFEPRASAGPNVDANAAVVWTRSDGTNLRVQSARRKDVQGYPRPRGATPFRAALVPAFKACSTPNRVHGPSLAFGSCAPPQQVSSILTIGSPDVNGAAANFTGSVRFIVLADNAATEADEADVRLVVSLADIRNNPSLTDYTGKVLITVDTQITDYSNSAEAPEPGTGQTFKYEFATDCVATASTSVGSNCNLTTTMDSIVPGTIIGGRRAMWQMGDVLVKDAGPNGTGLDSCPPTCGDGDETVFLRQGILVP